MTSFVQPCQEGGVEGVTEGSGVPGQTLGEALILLGPSFPFGIA